MIYDCAIIGAGPAGMIAAIQLKRAGLNCILLEKNQLGGLLKNANLVENYLGFPAVSGPDLIKIFQKHLQQAQIRPVFTEVKSIKRMPNTKQSFPIRNTKPSFQIQTTVQEYQAKTVILATGTQHLKANFPGESSSRVYYEISQLPKSAKEIIILGGGDIAFDYALQLQKLGRSPVILCHFPKALKILQDRAKFPVLQETITSIQETSNQIMAITKDKQFKADAIIIAIGREQSPPLINSQPGVFQIIESKNQRQVQIATGEGLKMAMQVEEYVNNKRNR